MIATPPATKRSRANARRVAGRAVVRAGGSAPERPRRRRAGRWPTRAVEPRAERSAGGEALLEVARLLLTW